MSTFESLRADILELFRQLGDIASARNADEARRRLDSARQQLLDERLVVVVCGEFKRGKSSLINALLEEPGLFPVDTFYATGVITTAGYAEPESVTVTTRPTPETIEQFEIRRDEIAAYATESGNPGNAKHVELVAIHTPNRRLAPGLTLVDTPGVGGVFEEHSAVTLGFLQSASALLFVTDATQPLLESELAFIRRAAETARVIDDPDGYLFALTKIDTVGDFGPVLANTKAKLAEVTGRPAEAIPVVPVSSSAKLEYLRNGSPDYLELSNFAVLEQTLWAAVARRRARALLTSSLTDLGLAAQALLAPLETENRALSGETRELTALAVQTENRATWLGQLRDNKDSWISDLANRLSEARNDLKSLGHERLDQVWQQCQTAYLYDDSYLGAPDLLLERVIADAAVAFAEVSELASRRAARALHAFSTRYGIELRRPEIEALAMPPAPPLRLSGNGPKTEKPRAGVRRWTLAAEGSRGASMAGASVGATVGGLIGTLVAPVAGTFIGMNIGGMVGFTLGSTAGTLTGYREAVKDAAEKGVQLRRDRLWAELEPLRKSQETTLAEDLEELMDDYVAAVTRELDSRVAQEQESVADALARLTALRDRADQAVERRRAELAAERAPFDRAFEQIGRLATGVAELGGTTPGLGNAP